MAIAVWQDEFSVGLTAMDIQHKQLVAMVNQLCEAMRQSRGDAIIGTILPSLVQYIKTHFWAEEKVMKDAGFPGLAAHQVIHRQLLQKITDLMEKFRTGRLAPTTGTASFMKDWLISHIQGQDKQYGDFIAGKKCVVAAG